MRPVALSSALLPTEENVTGLGVRPEEVSMKKERVVWAKSDAKAASFIAAFKTEYHSRV